MFMRTYNLNKLFNDAFFGYKHNLNVVFETYNLMESEKNYSLIIPVPGLTKDDVSANVENDILTVKYQKEYGENELRLTYSKYEKQITVPNDVNQDEISVKVENGVITVNLPKKEVPKNKKIITVF